MSSAAGVTEDFLATATDGKSYKTKFYNLDEQIKKIEKK